jgi:hypothetical protein
VNGFRPSGACRRAFALQANADPVQRGIAVQGGDQRIHTELVRHRGSNEIELAAVGAIVARSRFKTSSPQEPAPCRCETR